MMLRKLSLLTLALLLTLTTVFAQVNPNKVWVDGYYRSSGTYVKGHYRTAPNRTVNDNYSTVGNVNPHTGQRGWIPRDDGVNPYARTSSTPVVRRTPRARERATPVRTFPVRSTPVAAGTSLDLEAMRSLPLRYINTTRLNVRYGPGTGAVAFMQAQRSSTVRVIHRNDAPWTKVVVYDGSSYAVGYVHSDYLSTEKPLAPPSIAEATYTVTKFLGYLDEGKYEIAYGLSDNPSWKTLSWFSSAAAYGAVVSIRVEEARLVRTEGAEAVVAVRYYAEDPANKTGTYEQDFYLDGSSGDWRIRRAKLVRFEEDYGYRPEADPVLLPAAKARVEAYQRAVLTNDAEAVEEYFAPFLDRFFSFGPQSRSYVMREHRKYVQRWETLALSSEADSWRAREVPGGVEVSSTINLKLRRRHDGLRKSFRIRRIIVLNADQQIVHADEVIL